MANTSSAKKAVRKQTHRTFVNHARISRVRSFVRQVEKAIKEQGPSEAMAAFRVAQSEMMRAVAKGVLHRNTVSRKISRLNQRIKSL